MNNSQETAEGKYISGDFFLEFGVLFEFFFLSFGRHASSDFFRGAFGASLPS